MSQAYKIFFSFLFSFLSIQLFPQSFEHRKFHYDWSDEILITLSQSEKYKDYNAVILHEETTLDVGIRNIKRYQVIQFNDEAAIEKYNLFRVPIAMDPHLAALESNYRNETNDFPKLLFEKINFFDARIIRNGEFVKAVLDELAYKREERIGKHLLPMYVHYFYVRNLEPGDQLEVIISHQWPMYIFQYYLNEILPKQEAYITIHNTYMGKINVYTNLLVDSLKSYEKTADDKTHVAVFENLEPINPKLQTNVRDLPRIEMYLGKTPERSTQLFAEDIIDTLSWSEVLYGYVTTIGPNEPRSWEIYDDQSYRTTLFYNKVKKLTSDTTDGAHLMSFIHNYVVDEMEFKNDFNYFIHDKPGYEEMGTYLKNGIFREAARKIFYFNMADRINQPYYKTFLQDRRAFCLDTSVVSPLYYDYLSYVMFDKDSVISVYFPKCHRFGWYANELPFYFTGENIFLIPQNIPRSIYDIGPNFIQYPVIYIQPSPHKMNKKKVEAKVNVSLAKQHTSIQSEISLSGQFSTLIRGYYQYGWMDTTISPTYYADLCKKIEGTEIKLKTGQKTFPFLHSFTLNVPSYQNVFATMDSSYIIDLANLIHIHYENLEVKYFKANFRYDFTGKEEFIIELNFDQLVYIESMDHYNQEIIGSGFVFESSMVKVADNQYGLKVSWDITKDYTEQANLSILEEAFRAIKKFTHLKLKVKVQ